MDIILTYKTLPLRRPLQFLSLSWKMNTGPRPPIYNGPKRFKSLFKSKANLIYVFGIRTCGSLINKHVGLATLYIAPHKHVLIMPKIKRLVCKTWEKPLGLTAVCGSSNNERASSQRDPKLFSAPKCAYINTLCSAWQKFHNNKMYAGTRWITAYLKSTREFPF